MLSRHRILNYILQALDIGCRWMMLPIERDDYGRRKSSPCEYLPDDAVLAGRWQHRQDLFGHGVSTSSMSRLIRRYSTRVPVVVPELLSNFRKMQLTGRREPDFRTIADFRGDNGTGIAACSQPSRSRRLP